VLDVAGGSRDNGARLVLWSLHRGTNQQWRFERQGNGAYKIQAIHSGRLLEVRGASRQSGAQIIQWQEERCAPICNNFSATALYRNTLGWFQSKIKMQD